MRDWILPEEALRTRRSAKWGRYGDGVLPSWVAEMDFCIAPPVRAAIDRIRNEDDYGYPLRDGERADISVSRAFTKRMADRFGWNAEVELTVPLADLVQATFACILAYSDPGDDVILQIPAYPPFHEAIRQTHRNMVPHKVRYADGKVDLDLESLESLISDRTRIILLCNPQNPSGRVYTRSELETIAELAIERELVVISDEIHCDLVYKGNVHIPFASLGGEVAARTVTLNSATKSFNIPGLRCAVMHFGSAQLLERFHARVPHRLLGAPSVFGIDATVAAWSEGQPWLDEVLHHLREMRDHVATVIAERMPALQFYSPEATYLSWIDCSGLRLNQPAFQFFHDNAKVAFNAGETFDPDCASYVRLNFATSREVLEQILGRMSSAVYGLLISGDRH